MTGTTFPPDPGSPLNDPRGVTKSGSTRLSSGCNVSSKPPMTGGVAFGFGLIQLTGLIPHSAGVFFAFLSPKILWFKPCTTSPTLPPCPTTTHVHGCALPQSEFLSGKGHVRGFCVL